MAAKENHRRWPATLAAALLASALIGKTAAQQPAAELAIISGALDDGTQWAMAKPPNWNGTVIVDLDGAGAIRAATELDLGELYLCEPADIPPPARSWDASDWGTYLAD